MTRFRNQMVSAQKMPDRTPDGITGVIRGVELSEPEQLFRQCLLDCAKYISASATPALRFTGGWVRDKLMGNGSHDIDIAIDTMTGWQFGLAMQTFVKQHGSIYWEKAQKLGIQSAFGTLHQIAANPEKSKHLETVTTRMFGFDVDFVNLRKETYSEYSRNPQMEFGTPKEDALRRDCTVNALFYNLQTKSIEDFTERGLEDIKDKIIRTPLPPYETFKDDPLRVLRLVRFASRFGYQIEETTYAAMKEASIHEALKLKISRERIGIELGKMVTGPDPYGALMHIHQLNLYSTVFADPVDTQCPDPSKCPDIYKGLHDLLHSQTNLDQTLGLHDDPTLVWYLAAYTPFRDSEQRATQAAREGIKATNKVVKVLADSIKHRKTIQTLVDNASQGQFLRPRVGMCLRKFGSTWKYQVLFALFSDFMDEDTKLARQRYENFISLIHQEDLTGAAGLKPILDGKMLASILNATRGPWMSKAVEMVIEWQFENPHGTKDEAAEMIAGRRCELGLG